MITTSALIPGVSSINIISTYKVYPALFDNFNLGILISKSLPLTISSV